MNRLLALGCTLMFALSSQAKITTESVTYKYGDTTLKGFLAYDDSIEGKRPGVLVVHEWWGLNDYAKMRAKELAKMGYVAFACDMYGNGKVVEHPQDAGKMAGEVRMNKDVWVGRAKAGLEILKKNPNVDDSKLAAIGYCFGGSTALMLAYSGADIDAVSTFHAALPTATPEQAKAIKAKLLINHGAADPFVPAEAVEMFKGALDKANVEYDFEAYPDTVHSFTVKAADSHNIDGMAYNKAADEQSWAKMQALFAKAFSK